MVEETGLKEEVRRWGTRYVRRQKAEMVPGKELVLPPVGGVGPVGPYLFRLGSLGGFSFLVLILPAAAAVAAAVAGRGLVRSSLYSADLLSLLGTRWFTTGPLLPV